MITRLKLKVIVILITVSIVSASAIWITTRPDLDNKDNDNGYDSIGGDGVHRAELDNFYNNSWTNPMIIFEREEHKFINDPQMIVDSDGKYIVTFGYDQKIMIMTSIDTKEWTAPEVIIENDKGTRQPWLIQNKDGLYCLFYSTSLGNYNRDIWLSTSTDLDNWQSKGKLSINYASGNDNEPIVIQDDSGFYRMFFGSYRNNKYSYYYTSSEDLVSWSSEQELDAKQEYHEGHGWTSLSELSFTQDSDGCYWVFWSSRSERGEYNASANPDIWYTCSEDFVNWTEANKSTTNDDTFETAPIIRCHQGTYYLTFYRDYHFYIAISTDGKNWSTPSILDIFVEWDYNMIVDDEGVLILYINEYDLSPDEFNLFITRIHNISKSTNNLEIVLPTVGESFNETETISWKCKEELSSTLYYKYEYQEGWRLLSDIENPTFQTDGEWYVAEFTHDFTDFREGSEYRLKLVAQDKWCAYSNKFTVEHNIPPTIDCYPVLSTTSNDYTNQTLPYDSYNPIHTAFTESYTTIEYSSELREMIVDNLVEQTQTHGLDPSQMRDCLNATGIYEMEGTAIMPCYAEYATFEGKSCWLFVFNWELHSLSMALSLGHIKTYVIDSNNLDILYYQTCG